jgi:hypothetical protein
VGALGHDRLTGHAGWRIRRVGGAEPPVRSEKPLLILC